MVSGEATEIVCVAPKVTLNAPPLKVPAVPVLLTGLGAPANEYTNEPLVGTVVLALPTTNGTPVGGE
jgi:hypothetical protein